MKLKIEIDLENDAFQSTKKTDFQMGINTGELRKHLIVIANCMNDPFSKLQSQGKQTIIDSNGNTVGKAEVTE